MVWWCSLWSSGSEEDSNEKFNPDTNKPRENQQSTIAANAFPTPSISPSDSSSSSPSHRSREWDSLLNTVDWEHFKEPQNLIPTVLLTGAIILVIQLHRKYLRRIPQATNISPSSFRRRSLLGRVTSVGDGDNFRIFHTPGGWLAGWGWFPWKKIPTSKKELKDRTIHVRLAGIDAPELAHFGRPEQPFAKEAHNWLISYLSYRRVRAYVHRPDQYQRVVATVYVRRFWDFPIPFRRRDVSYEMLIRGLATVYEAKTGAEYGGEKREQDYRRAEQLAKAKGRGLWRNYRSTGGKNWESPREYKNRMKLVEAAPAEMKAVQHNPSVLSSLSSWLFSSEKQGKK